MSIRIKSFCAIVALAWGGLLTEARAQNFPSRPITLVIPFAPGGSTSIIGRGIADKMSDLLHGSSILSTGTTRKACN
jgi:tripartite-type tricarboxylate transporter receptor subunit TctC